MAKDIIRTVQVDAVGRDSNGEPTARTFAAYDPEDLLPSPRVWVLPITEEEYERLSEALPESETGLVKFKVPQSRFTMARDAQTLRESVD